MLEWVRQWQTRLTMPTTPPGDHPGEPLPPGKQITALPPGMFSRDRWRPIFGDLSSSAFSGAVLAGLAGSFVAGPAGAIAGAGVGAVGGAAAAPALRGRHGEPGDPPTHHQKQVLFYGFLGLVAVLLVAGLLIRSRAGASINETVIVEVLTRAVVAAASTAWALVPVLWFAFAAHGNPSATVSEDLAPGSALDPVLGALVLGILIMEFRAISEWWNHCKTGRK